MTLFILQLENPIRRGGVDVAIFVHRNRVHYCRAEQAVIDLSPGLTGIEGDLCAAVRAGVDRVRIVRVKG